jgi:hypothetical protein
MKPEPAVRVQLSIQSKLAPRSRSTPPGCNFPSNQSLHQGRNSLLRCTIPSNLSLHHEIRIHHPGASFHPIKACTKKPEPAARVHQSIQSKLAPRSRSPPPGCAIPSNLSLHHEARIHRLGATFHPINACTRGRNSLLRCIIPSNQSLHQEAGARCPGAPFHPI